MTKDEMRRLIAEAQTWGDDASLRGEARGAFRDLASALDLALTGIETLQAREAARVRDAEHPEYVPEAVMDAAFDSQREWFVPGETPPIVTVHVAPLVESVATAVYAATREATDHEVGGQR